MNYRNDAIKLIFVKLFSVSQNAHCDTEVEKQYNRSLEHLALTETSVENYVMI
jgi:hypothetical protein